LWDFSKSGIEDELGRIVAVGVKVKLVKDLRSKKSGGVRRGRYGLNLKKKSHLPIEVFIVMSLPQPTSTSKVKINKIRIGNNHGVI